MPSSQAKKKIRQPRTKMKKDEIFRFFEILRNENPSPQSDLKYTNAFTLLVAVVLSAQATDAGVNKATQELFQIADTPQAILDMGEDALKSHIKTIGLFNSKATNIMKLCDLLVNDFNSQVPDNRDDLMKLPGVGRKTANVVLNIIFKQPTMAVDTHVYRVSNRTGLAPAKTHDQVEDKLVKIIPNDFMMHAHHWLILHGRYVCKARKPECFACQVNSLCKFKDKTMSA